MAIIRELQDLDNGRYVCSWFGNNYCIDEYPNSTDFLIDVYFRKIMSRSLLGNLSLDASCNKIFNKFHKRRITVSVLAKLNIGSVWEDGRKIANIKEKLHRIPSINVQRCQIHETSLRDEYQRMPELRWIYAALADSIHLPYNAERESKLIVLTHNNIHYLFPCIELIRHFVAHNSRIIQAAFRFCDYADPNYNNFFMWKRPDERSTRTDWLEKEIGLYQVIYRNHLKNPDARFCALLALNPDLLNAVSTIPKSLVHSFYTRRAGYPLMKWPYFGETSLSLRGIWAEKPEKAKYFLVTEIIKFGIPVVFQDVIGIPERLNVSPTEETPETPTEVVAVPPNTLPNANVKDLTITSDSDSSSEHSMGEIPLDNKREMGANNLFEEHLKAKVTVGRDRSPRYRIERPPDNISDNEMPVSPNLNSTKGGKHARGELKFDTNNRLAKRYLKKLKVLQGILDHFCELEEMEAIFVTLEGDRGSSATDFFSDYPNLENFSTESCNFRNPTRNNPEDLIRRIWIMEIHDRLKKRYSYLFDIEHLNSSDKFSYGIAIPIDGRSLDEFHLEEIIISNAVATGRWGRKDMSYPNYVYGDRKNHKSIEEDQDKDGDDEAIKAQKISNLCDAILRKIEQIKKQ